MADKSSVLEQIKEVRGAIVALIAVFLLGVAFQAYMNVPERLAEVEELAQDNRRDFQRFVDRFDRWLCIQEAEADGVSASNCT